MFHHRSQVKLNSPSKRSRRLNKALIFGITDFAELFFYHICKDNPGCEIVGFVADQAYLHHDHFFGLPTTCFENITTTYPADEFGVYVCIGYRGMNAYRRDVYGRLHAMGYTILSYFHHSAQVDAKSIGEGAIVLQNVLIDAYCSIGEGNVFYPGATLAHHCNIGNFNFFSPQCTIAGRVDVGDNCYFGVHSTVKNGVTIGDRTLAGAGAYVSKNTKQDSVVVPARSLILPDKKSTDFM